MRNIKKIKKYTRGLPHIQSNMIQQYKINRNSYVRKQLNLLMIKKSVIT